MAEEPLDSWHLVEIPLKPPFQLPTPTQLPPLAHLSPSHSQPKEEKCGIFHLPLELRLIIYNLIILPTKTQTLYISRDIYTWFHQLGTRSFLNLFLINKQIHEEASDLLYSRHSLQLYTCLRTRQASSVHTRLCGIEDYGSLLKRVQKLHLTIFVTGDAKQINFLIALMGWVRALIQERERPMKLLILEFCANDWKAGRRATALLYAAQGFRGLQGPVEFRFQCGFGGGQCEDAVGALMKSDGEEKDCGDAPIGSSKDAFERLLVTWKNWKKSRAEEPIAGKVDQLVGLCGSYL